MDRPPILLEPKSLCGNTPPSRETGEKATGNTQAGARGSVSSERVVGALCARDYKGVGNQYVSEGKLVVEKQPTKKVYGLNSQQPPARLTEEYCDTLVASNYKEPMGVVYGFDTKQQTPKIEKELTQTLVATGYKEPIGVVSVAGNIIGRSPQNGGNGDGFDEEVCYTLTTADRHAVALRQNYIYEPKAFSFDSLSSNSMKSANPNSGCREVDLSKCLDTTYPCPSKNQGGIAITHVFKERAGCEGGGKGYMGQDEKACTLSTSQDQNLLHKSIIRRLTPTECEILQGFPKFYTKIPYRKKDIDQCPDSPRYKALGNSMAVPVMAHIGKKIQKAVAA